MPSASSTAAAAPLSFSTTAIIKVLPLGQLEAVADPHHQLAVGNEPLQLIGQLLFAATDRCMA